MLNEQVSNIAKDANTRMSRLHADNLAQLRSRYMKIMYEHCRDIADNLSVTDPDKPYGNIAPPSMDVPCTACA